MELSPSEPTDVTVIIATRNRGAALADVLERLRLQDTSAVFTFDVLVVDNGSSDETAHVAQERHRTLPVPLRYLREERVGRPHALNAGIAFAVAPVFAFTDDDTVPTPGWLHTLWSCLHEERVDAVTGRVLPLWTSPRPEWLTDEAFRALGRLGCLDHGPSRLRTADGQNCRWFTSNLMIRRDVVRRLGGWDTRLSYFQDTEYYRRAVAAGVRVAYEPAAVVHHKIGAERLTPKYFRRRRRHGGLYRAQQARWTRRHLLTVMPLGFYGSVWRSMVGWITCTLRRDPWWRRFQHELALREALSTWWYRLRLWPRWWRAVLGGRSSMP